MRLIYLLFIFNLIFAYNSDPTARADDSNYFTNNNPASTNKNIIIGFSPNNFQVEELDFIYIASYFNKDNYSINLALNSINNNLNNEININLGFIYKYNNLFDVGFRTNYTNNNIKNYVNLDNISFDLGAILYFDSLTIASYFNNVYSSNNELYNQQYFRIAAGYNLDLFSFYFGPELFINNNYGLNTGIKYRITENINLRINYSSLFNIFNLSFSILFNNYIINLSLAKHNSLGYSQDYQILYDF